MMRKLMISVWMWLIARTQTRGEAGEGSISIALGIVTVIAVAGILYDAATGEIRDVIGTW